MAYKEETIRLENLIKEAGLGRLISLPHECVDSHVYVSTQVSEDSKDSNVMPVKIKYATNTQNGPKFSGLHYAASDHVLLWDPNKEEKRFCILPFQELKVKGATMNAIKSHHASRMFYDKNQLSTALHMTYEMLSQKDALANMTAVQQITKHKKMTREENVAKYGAAQRVESDSMTQLSDIIGDIFVKTPPSTRADAYLKVEGYSHVLPVQVKAANVGPDNTFSFGIVFGYNDHLLLCRPLILNGGTLVLPGNLITTKGLKYRLNSKKYCPYLVPDNQLRSFVVNIIKDIDENHKTSQWPSGTQVDISALKYQDMELVCSPENQNCKTEYQNRSDRVRLCPDLIYREPDVHNTVVDMFIEGLRVQDKTGERTSAKTFHVTIAKNAGLVNGKQTKKPYDSDDFDILWVFIPGNKYFYIIPMRELIKHGIVSTRVSPGRTGLNLNIHQKTYHNREYWSDRYRFETSNPNIADDVKQHLNKIKADLGI